MQRICEGQEETEESDFCKRVRSDRHSSTHNSVSTDRVATIIKEK